MLNKKQDFLEKKIDQEDNLLKITFARVFWKNFILLKKILEVKLFFKSAMLIHKLI